MSINVEYSGLVGSIPAFTENGVNQLPTAMKLKERMKAAIPLAPALGSRVDARLFGDVANIPINALVFQFKEVVESIKGESWIAPTVDEIWATLGPTAWADDDPTATEVPMRLPKVPTTQGSEDRFKNILVVGNGPQTFPVKETGSTRQYERLSFA